MQRYDVTLTLSAGTPVFPGDPPVRVRRFASLREHGYSASAISLSLHAGTHVDAPCHLFAESLAAEALELAALVGPALVLDCCGQEAIDQPLLARYWPGQPERLLLKTGGGETLRRGGPGTGYLTAAGAAFLAAQGARLVGIESLSVDALEDHGLPAHRELLGRGVVVLEGIDLTEVPAGVYELICLPLKVQGGDAAPARVLLVPCSSRLPTSR